MIGSQPTDSKNSSDNRRFVTDSMATFRAFYESNLKSNFTRAEQQKVEERIFLKDPQLVSQHASFSSGAINQEQLLQKIRESLGTSKIISSEDPAVADKPSESLRRMVKFCSYKRSNFSSSGPMPEIKLGNICAEPLKQSSELKVPVDYEKKNNTPELATQPTLDTFKRNQLNFVLQHEGLGYDIIGNFLKYHSDSNHQVASSNNDRN
jgi:hypothetical protein